VHIVTRRRLPDFAAKPLDAWYRIVKAKRYEGPAAVKADFATASFLSGDRAAFSIGGNKHRLAVTMRYEMGRCFIRSVLTHEEYDRRSKDGTL
jgi:mRNA interferase HigB